MPTKVNIHAEAEASAPAPKANAASVTDARGRTIAIRRLGPVERMRLAKLVGASAANQVYMGYATLAYAVTAIDGDPVHPPISERELEFLVGRLDDDGLEAVGTGYVESFNITDLSDEAKAALKNL